MKTHINFRLLNEVCMQANFRNESETAALVKKKMAIESFQTCISMFSLRHQPVSLRLITEHAKD